MLLKSTPSDCQNELFRRIAEGDEKAFYTFFHQYKDRFYAVALKMTRSEPLAKEMVQELFIKIWKNRSTLQTIFNADAYFFTALYRAIFRHYQQLASERKMIHFLADTQKAVDSTYDTISANETEKLLREAMSKLPPQQKVIFSLSKIEGMSREEIADKLDLSPNTVRNHLAAAVKAVKTQLDHSMVGCLVLSILL